MVTLTDRGRDVVVVVGSLVALAVALWIVTPMLGRAWSRDGLVFNAVYAVVVGILGLDIDVAVALPAGVVAGWLVLFAADGYKTLQGIILGLIGGPVFLVSLQRLGLWWETVAWANYWWAVCGGLGGGVVTGAIGSEAGTDFDLDLRRFPAATAALYLSLSAVVVVAFLEAHLEYTSPLVWNLRAERAVTGPIGSVTVRTEELIVDAIGSVTLVTVLGIFTQYSSDTTVRIVGPSGPSRANVLGGLFAHADASDEYRGVGATVDSAATYLNDAKNADSREDLPTEPEASAFKFRRGPFKRQKIVRAEAHLPPEAHEIRSLRERAERRRTRRWRAVHYLGRGIGLAIPNQLMEGRRDGGQFLTRIERSDVLLLTVPFEELLEETEDVSDMGSSRDRVGESYLERYANLCEIYRDDPGTDVVVVITGAARARELLGRRKDSVVSLSPRGASDLDDLAELLGIGGCTVHPFDREFDGDGPKYTDAKWAEGVLRRI